MECCLITYFMMHNWKLCTLVSTMIWKHLLFINKERLVCLYFFVTNICGILKGSFSKIGFLKILRDPRKTSSFNTFFGNQKIHYLQKQDGVMSLWAKAIEWCGYFHKFHHNFNKLHKVFIDGKMLVVELGDKPLEVHYTILSFWVCVFGNSYNQMCV